MRRYGLNPVLRARLRRSISRKGRAAGGAPAHVVVVRLARPDARYLSGMLSALLYRCELEHVGTAQRILDCLTESTVRGR